MEQGEPSIMPIKSLRELSTTIPKAPCIQAVHEGGPHHAPLSATVDFAKLKPLTRGAPTIPMPHLVSKWGKIKGDTGYNKEGNDAPKQLFTWAELMHGIVDYSREMGWDAAAAEKQTQKSRGRDHKVRPVKQGRDIRSNGNKIKNSEAECREWRNELWH